MILYPPVGPLKYQPEPRSWGETSGEHPVVRERCPKYIRKAKQARDPGVRRLGSTKNAAHREGAMIHPAPVGPLWGSEMPDIVVYFVVCMCVVSVVYIVV